MQLSTLENRLGVHALPRAVCALGQANHHRRWLAGRCVRDGYRHQHGADAEKGTSCHVWLAIASKMYGRCFDDKEREAMHGFYKRRGSVTHSSSK
jgi:hypothetical protein